MNPELPITKAAAIPFRARDGKAECCLITSSSQPVFWTIPKGTIEPGDTPEITAKKETLEEAGLEGRVSGNSLGTFNYQKNGNTMRVTVFLLRVDRVLDHWDEEHVRKRQWVSSAAALEILSPHPVLPILKNAMIVAENIARVRKDFNQQ